MYYRKKLKCVDPEDVQIFGDYNSEKAMQFVVQFEKCNQTTFDGVCKTEDEISTWLRKKYILGL